MSRIANEQVNHSSTRWANLVTVVHQIEAEYREMPGLSVTEAQARRLWGLDEATCRRALNTLLRRGILRRTRRQSYVRTESGPPSNAMDVAHLLAELEREES